MEHLKSILDDPTNVSYTTSKGSNYDCNIFASTTNAYDSHKGYLLIENPGWIKIFLKESRKISYIRFLLWDNRGSAIKRQPSNRKYSYRVLISENDGNNHEWNAIYENTLNPSNGWQEFYFEDGPKDINAIKIQFFQNSSASTEHNKGTQLVSIQAFSEPTMAITKMLDRELQSTIFTPVPNLGYIRNRIIIGNEQDKLSFLVEEEIIKQIQLFINTIETSNEEETTKLAIFRSELENRSGNNDIEKQINIFNSSIFKPINQYKTKIGIRYRRLSRIATLLLFISVCIDIYEAYTGIDILDYVVELLKIANTYATNIFSRGS